MLCLMLLTNMCFFFKMRENVRRPAYDAVSDAANEYLFFLFR
jgi:hypothetical protein